VPPCATPPHHHQNSFNKYVSVAARATRQALKEEQRVAAERRAAVTLKVQKWENGKAGTAVRPPFPLEQSLRGAGASEWAARSGARALDSSPSLFLTALFQAFKD